MPTPTLSRMTARPGYRKARQQGGTRRQAGAERRRTRPPPQPPARKQQQREGWPAHPPTVRPRPRPRPERALRRDQARHKALMVPCGRLSLSSRCLAAPRTLQTVPRRTPGLPPRTPNPTGTAPPVLYYPRAPRTRPALRRHRARRHPALWMAGDYPGGLPAAWSSGGPHTCNARVPRRRTRSCDPGASAASGSGRYRDGPGSCGQSV